MRPHPKGQSLLAQLQAWPAQQQPTPELHWGWTIPPMRIGVSGWKLTQGSDHGEKHLDEFAVLSFPVPESPVHRMARPPSPTLTLPLSKRNHEKRDRSLSRNSRDSVEIFMIRQQGCQCPHFSLLLPKFSIKSRPEQKYQSRWISSRKFKCFQGESTEENHPLLCDVCRTDALQRAT